MPNNNWKENKRDDTFNKSELTWVDLRPGYGDLLLSDMTASDLPVARKFFYDNNKYTQLRTTINMEKKEASLKSCTVYMKKVQCECLNLVIRLFKWKEVYWASSFPLTYLFLHLHGATEKWTRFTHVFFFLVSFWGKNQPVFMHPGRGSQLY